MRTIITLIAAIILNVSVNAQEDIVSNLVNDLDISVGYLAINLDSTMADTSIYGKDLNLLYKDYYNKCLKIIIYYENIKHEVSTNLDQKSEVYKHYSKDLDLKLINQMEKAKIAALKSETNKFGVRLMELCKNLEVSP